jgi:hypothetical protein
MLCIATGLFGLFFFLTLFATNVLGYSAIRAEHPATCRSPSEVVIASRWPRGWWRIGPRPLILAAPPGRGRDVLVLPADQRHAATPASCSARCW